MTNNVVRLPTRTYNAKSFPVDAFGGAPLSGTLDGFIDFHVPRRGTYQLSLDDARQLIAALSGVIEDIRANCLYDRDELLEQA